jgi:hypothetical protein
MKIITARSDSTLTQDQLEFLEQFLTPEELAELKAEIGSLDARNNVHPMDCQRTLHAIEQSKTATKH